MIVILRTTKASPVGFLDYKAKNVRKCLKIPQPILQFNNVWIYFRWVLVNALIGNRPTTRIPRCLLASGERASFYCLDVHLHLSNHGVI